MRRAFAEAARAAAQGLVAALAHRTVADVSRRALRHGRARPARRRAAGARAS
jgi:hypothetical protein